MQFENNAAAVQAGTLTAFGQHFADVDDSVGGFEVNESSWVGTVEQG
jgi:hypothetical protein